MLLGSTLVVSGIHASSGTLVVADGMHEFVAGGWDAGMSHHLAASAFTLSSNYFEDCPDSATGRCYQSVRPGSGFYTLGGGSTNQTCKVNSGNSSKWTP